MDVKLANATQHDLIITKPKQPIISVDNLEVAQFLYLLIANEKLRNVIDTITSKVVLILGRFSEKRLLVLEELKMLARQKDLIPIIFNFEVPTSRSIVQTVRTIAQLSRFVIADLTAPRSVPAELQAIASLGVPIATLIHYRSKPYALFTDLQQEYHWVLPPRTYRKVEDLASIFPVLLSATDSKRADIRPAR